MGRLPIVKPNREKGAIHVSNKLVKTLETKVSDLIELSTELKLENQALKKRLADLQHEKRDLLMLSGLHTTQTCPQDILSGQQ